MAKAQRVAICQSSIIPGGRLRVVLGIIEVLNQAGIVPDLLTGALSIHTDDIATAYGQQPRAKYRILPRVPAIPFDLATALFNLTVNRYRADYDLLINTSNSMIFLPRSLPVISYIFYPRKARIMAREPDLHRPETVPHRTTPSEIGRRMLRLLYRFEKPHANHKIICMTEFTRTALQRVYKVPPDSPTIYPPVDTQSFRGGPPHRKYGVVTVGRFSPEKRQMKQIQVADQCPELDFHLLGFSGDGEYLRQCKRLIETLEAGNVHLYPDAPFGLVKEMLQNARLFLHTLVNEPFGLTTAQAIAAGCLPVVHNSGGQREVVIDEDLRYDAFTAIPAKLRQCEGLSATTRHARVVELQRHVVANFDQSVFCERMRGFLSDYVAFSSG